MTTVITTTGTSIAQGIRPLDNACADKRQINQYGHDIDQRLRGLRDQHEDDVVFLQRACAESNSLRAFGLTRNDRVVLLHSETEDGKICARKVARLLQTRFGCEVTNHEIKGLQVRDAHRFRRTGIPNLFQTLDRVSNNADGPTVLNATGGFKSVVPYLTLYGILRRLPVIYIFERSDTLITLPPAPLNFDYERIARARDVLLRIHQETAIPENEFFRAIPGLLRSEREWYEILIEDAGDGQVTLSAFGFLLAEMAEKETADAVYLSPRARGQYDQAEGVVREQFTFMLERVREPLWRQGHRHHFTGTDLAVFKPGNTAQRMACILRGNRVYVCVLFATHDEYEEQLPAMCEADFDLRQFSPWTRPHQEPEPPSSEEEAYRRACKRAEEAEKRAALAEQRLREAEEERDRAKAELERRRLPPSGNPRRAEGQADA